MLTEKIDDMKNILLIALCSLLFGMSAAAQISKRLVRANKIEAASALSVDDKLDIPATCGAKFTEYGNGDKEAADLTKTASHYVPAFATDGTFLERAAKTGFVSDTTSAAGDITVAVGATMPDSTYAVIITAHGVQQSAVVRSRAVGAFVVRFYNSTTPINAGPVRLSWRVEDY